MSAGNEAIFEGFEDLFAGIGTPTTNPVEVESGVTATPVMQENNGIVIENTNSANVVKAAQSKLVMIKREMNDNFMERDAVIDCMIYALVSGQSMLMLGDPGTARVDIIA